MSFWPLDPGNYRFGIRRIFLLVALVAAGCGGESSRPVVHSAASLTDVVPELVDAFGIARGRTDFQFNFGGSSTLALQIADGAPPGVFLSADATTMELAREGGDVSDPVLFARNRLVLVRSPGAPVAELSDLAEPSLLVGLCAPTVPCGALAVDELDRLGIVARPDTEEPDVRTLLAKVASGELDAALVYATDAVTAGDAVEVIESDLSETTPYFAAVVGPDAPDGSREFVAFLGSRTAQQLLAEAGFEAP